MREGLCENIWSADSFLCEKIRVRTSEFAFISTRLEMKRRRGIEDATERAKRPKPTQSAEKRTDIGDWAKSLFEKGAIPATELVKGARAEKASSSASGASSLSERLSRGKRPTDHASRDVMRALNKNISPLI